MLTDASYLYAISTYLLSGFLLAFLLAYFSRNWLTPSLKAPCFLIFLGIFLVPAYPGDGIETMAPALVVAAFLAFTYDFDTASHAVRPLGLGLFFSCFISLLLLVSRAVFSKKS